MIRILLPAALSLLAISCRPPGRPDEADCAALLELGVLGSSNEQLQRFRTCYADSFELAMTGGLITQQTDAKSADTITFGFVRDWLVVARTTSEYAQMREEFDRHRATAAEGNR